MVFSCCNWNSLRNPKKSRPMLAGTSIFCLLSLVCMVMLPFLKGFCTYRFIGVVYLCFGPAK